MKKRIFVLAVCAAALVALRSILVFRYAFDSDEPQHMHVAWAWAHGLVQYRDVFDNHMPLFHILASPLFLWRGEDVRLLFLARFAVLPLFVISLALVWRISRTLNDARTAWWTTAMVALFAPFFLGTLEFRTDDLWLVLWLGAIAVAIGERPLEQRSWRAALLIGLAFAVSMKSTLFLIALGGAVIVMYALTFRVAGRISIPRALRIGGISALMMALPPAIVAGAFAAGGAWRQFQYGVFLHNVFPHETPWRAIWLVPAFFVTQAGARSLLRAIDPANAATVAIGRRRLFVFLACMIFGGVLSGLWPMLSLESYLPFYPLALIVSVPLVLESSAVLGERNLLAKACIAVELVALLLVSTPWKNNTPDETELVAEVLSITAPNDPVMDLKGETLFRSRPYFLVIESITNRKFRHGWIADDIADALVRSSTHVVATDRLPQRSRRFVHANYIPWGHVRVAGFRLPPMANNECVPVTIEVSGDYVLLGDSGPVAAGIDGGAYENRIFLGAGEHMLRTSAAARQPLLIWAGALRSAESARYRIQAVREGEDPRRRVRLVQRDLIEQAEPRVTAGG